MTGTYAQKIIAFARCWQSNCVITVAPRFLFELMKEGELPCGKEVWKDTIIQLPGGNRSSWINDLTGHTISAEGGLPVGDICRDLPAALLSSQDYRYDDTVH